MNLAPTWMDWRHQDFQFPFLIVVKQDTFPIGVLGNGYVGTNSLGGRQQQNVGAYLICTRWCQQSGAPLQRWKLSHPGPQRVRCTPSGQRTRLTARTGPRICPPKRPSPAA